ncbi:MAG: acyl-CoA dehydrogenase family protein [Deltaproteobacteria bacterium]|nr:acyl-CoA dehydrogenase family protein [Deltaproteobacteria bacterium]
MNFIPTEDQRSLIDLAAKANRQWLAPITEKDDEEGRFRREIISELGKLGLTGISTPAEYDGAGLGCLENALAMEELSSGGVAYAISIGVSGLAQLILNSFGTEAQKRKYIPKLAVGEHIGAFSLTESGSGSDAAALKTRAEKGDGEYVISGTKLFTTQGNIADTMVVFARTGAEGSKGISAFVVEKGMAGVRTGKLEHKMGARISPTCEMIFENVRVPAENLLGREGDGFKIALTALDSGRINIGAIAVGLARGALEFAVKYSSERKQFGRAIRDFQGIQFMLADMYAALEASRLLVQRASSLKDAGLPFTREAATAKFFATDSAMKITTDAVQILGGCGYMKEYPVERYMREAKVLQIVEGTNQIQRMLVGRSL